MKNLIIMLNIFILLLIVVAFIPTAIILYLAFFGFAAVIWITCLCFLIRFLFQFKKYKPLIIRLTIILVIMASEYYYILFNYPEL